MELAQLKDIWAAAGRPGQAKFRDAAKRKGLTITVKQASDFVQAQGVSQVFRAPPKSEGKITSPGINDRWQCDLVDYKSKSPEKNDDYRLILVCVDIFSRFMYTELLKTKEASEVTEAFLRIQRRARGRLSGKTAVVPREVTSDTGQEFRGAFSAMLQKQGIGHRFKESINSLAVVDAAIRTLKVMIAKDMADSSSDSWSKAVGPAVVAYNSNSHPAIMNSAPEDVKKTPALEFELEKQAGYDFAANHNINQSRIDKLRELGAFRILLPRQTWTRADRPQYSETVHEFLMIYGQDVVAVDGTKALIQRILPVPLGSSDVKIPRELKPGRPIRDVGAKAALYQFATALRGIIGPGSLSLQAAGTKLRAIPGFSEAMTEHKITGIGALQRFLEMFSEFVIEGKAPKASVRLA